MVDELSEYTKGRLAEMPEDMLQRVVEGHAYGVSVESMEEDARRIARGTHIRTEIGIVTPEEYRDWRQAW